MVSSEHLEIYAAAAYICEGVRAASSEHLQIYAATGYMYQGVEMCTFRHFLATGVVTVRTRVRVRAAYCCLSDICGLR